MPEASVSRSFNKTIPSQSASTSLPSVRRDLELGPKSVLFWMTLLVSIGIIFIGARFLLAPNAAAAAYGVPANAGPPQTYLWVKGLRDIVSGLIFIALLWSGASRRLIGTILYVATLIPLGDMAIVYASVGAGSVLLIHGGTAVFMLVVATLMRRGSAPGLPE